MIQAKQQRVSPESIVLQSLSQSFCPLYPETSQNILATSKKQPLTSHAQLRATQPRAKTSSLETLQQLRDEARY